MSYSTVTSPFLFLSFPLFSSSVILFSSSLHFPLILYSFSSLLLLTSVVSFSLPYTPPDLFFLSSLLICRSLSPLNCSVGVRHVSFRSLPLSQILSFSPPLVPFISSLTCHHLLNFIFFSFPFFPFPPDTLSSLHLSLSLRPNVSNLLPLSLPLLSSFRSTHLSILLSFLSPQFLSPLSLSPPLPSHHMGRISP